MLLGCRPLEALIQQPSVNGDPVFVWAGMSEGQGMRGRTHRRRLETLPRAGCPGKVRKAAQALPRCPDGGIGTLEKLSGC